MVNIAKVGDSAVKFTFTDNDHYLFNGEIEVPLNSLLLILDESDMATFKKIDGDPFVSFLISNSNFDSKEALETFYKENMVGGGGGGLTPEEAQTMIDDSISGKADTSAVTEAITEAVSGKADTSTVEAISNGLTAHTSNTNIHVTANDKSTWNGKQDALVSGSNIKTVNNESLLGSGNIEIEGGNNVVEVTQAEYDALVTAGTVDLSAIYVITDAPEIDMSNYYTSAQTNSAITAAVSGKADSSAVTESINAAVSGKMDTSAFTAYSASTDARISQDEEVTARALVDVNDALSGKQDTLIAGDNITISGNVISASGGGSSVNVVQTTGNSTTDVMSQNAVTSSLGNLSKISKNRDEGITRWYDVKKYNGTFDFTIYNFSINGKLPLSKETRNSDYSNFLNFHLVETSAITSSITSASTNSQVPSAKAVYDALQEGGGEVSSAITSGDTNAVAGGAVYDKFDEVEQVTAAALNSLNDALGGMKFVKLTQAEYDALAVKDPMTLYIITNVV